LSGNEFVAQNQAEELRLFCRKSKCSLPKRVFIWDETLRDGEQSPGVFFSVDEKIAIGKLLDEIGVSIIDAGFPLVSEDERIAIRALARENFSAAVGVTIRALEKDIDVALSCDVREVHMFLPSSRLHLHHKFKIDEKECLRRAVAATEYAKRHGLIVDFIAEDATRTSPAFLHELYSAVIGVGADRVMLTDTVGVMSPEAMFRFSANTIDALKDDRTGFAVHCHNDFGLATANTAAAVLAGATYPTVTVNGIGERAGNAAFEEVVLCLEKLYGVKTGIRLEMLSELSALVEQASGMFNAVHKPVVGHNAFRHESGIHVDGVLHNVATYEPIKPEEVGCNRAFVLGKHSGRNLVIKLLSERKIRATPEQVGMICEQVKCAKESRDKSSMRGLAAHISAYQQHSLGFSENEFWRIVSTMVDSDEVGKCR